MKYLLISLVISILLISIAKSEEISLFDNKGAPIAYIGDDKDGTVFLWDGTPVAYLVNKSNENSPNTNNSSIFGFNGKHLAWLIKGIIRDHDGNAVGFIKGAVQQSTSYETYKGYKKHIPYKNYKDYEPYKPYLTNSWSEVPLKYFLKEGIE